MVLAPLHRLYRGPLEKNKKRGNRRSQSETIVARRHHSHKRDNDRIVQNCWGGREQYLAKIVIPPRGECSPNIYRKWNGTCDCCHCKWNQVWDHEEVKRERAAGKEEVLKGLLEYMGN